MLVLVVVLVAIGAAALARPSSDATSEAAPPPSAGPTVASPAPSDAETLAPDRLARQVCRTVPREVLVRTVNGTNLRRSGDLQMITPFPDYVSSGLTHATPFDHTQEVPLLLYGPGWSNPASTASRRRSPTSRRRPPRSWSSTGSRRPTGARSTRRSCRPTNAIRRSSSSRWSGTRPASTCSTDGRRSWPYLRKLARNGAWFTNAQLNSAPANTPPSHATIGTGAYPATARVRRRVHLDRRVAAQAERGGTELPEAADARRRLRPRDEQRADRGRRREPLGAPDDDGPRPRLAGRRRRHRDRARGAGRGDRRRRHGEQVGTHRRHAPVLPHARRG